MLKTYRGIAVKELDENKFASYYTPFQFTLPILQALYFQIEKESEALLDEDVRQVGLGHLKARNPADRSSAFSTSLRAIAYLSWEPESRVFLVRRVFPTYFDFLSVSHIPEGWGVSSIMLEALQTKFDKSIQVLSGDFELIDMEAPSTFQYTSPYLAEQKRLKYEQVVVLPVFGKDRPESDRDMLGTFLFFINTAEGVPAGHKEKKQLHSFTEALCKATRELVVLHKTALDPYSLPEQWRRIRLELQAKARIAKVILRCDHAHNGTLCLELESAARDFLRALTVPNHYAIRDPTEELDHEIAVFLVTARHDIDMKDFKKRLLRIVTEQLSERKVTCDVSIKTGDPTTDGVFHLTADHKWH